MEATPSSEVDLREQAITQLKKKRDFRSHVAANAWDVYGRADWRGRDQA